MALSTPVDLEPKNWYYNTSTDRVFKMIKNNTTYNISTNESSGYIIAKPPNENPIKLDGEYIDKQLSDDNITEIEHREDIRLRATSEVKNQMETETETAAD